MFCRARKNNPGHGQTNTLQVSTPSIQDAMRQDLLTFKKLGRKFPSLCAKNHLLCSSYDHNNQQIACPDDVLGGGVGWIGMKAVTKTLASGGAVVHVLRAAACNGNYNFRILWTLTHALPHSLL